MGGGSQDAPDVVGAARQEGYDARLAAQQETLANRPDQYGPKWNTEWTRTAIDPKTGLPYDESLQNVGWDHDRGDFLGGYIAPGDRHYEWTQNNTLSDPFQKLLDTEIASAGDAQYYRNQQARDWYANPSNFSTGGVDGTIGRGDLDQFGRTQANMGADDWRQFGSTAPTIGADQWQDLGYTNNTIGSDDWREFGNTERTIQSGDWDSRWGSSQDHGYGDHDMGGGDWSLIQYEPEHIRRQAEQQTLDFMNSQLDPQWQTKREALEIQLANQGLQWGDAAYDNAMSAFERSKSTAYAGARNQALADSRAEAMMLWDQEMGMSEQKNKYLQQDWANEFQARQANIGNYLSGRGQDQNSYLAYQQAAFDQDRLARQQQLDANLGYGRESYQQDLMGRQQALDAQLGYGREAYSQDFQSRQADIDNNRLYSQQAFDQDLQARQAAISNYLNYGNAEFDQGMQNENLTLQQRLAQEKAQQDRYALVNPADNAANIAGILSE